MSALAVLAPAARAETVVFEAAVTIGANDTTYDGKDIIVRGCTVIIDGAHTFSSLALERNAGNQPGVVTHTADFSNGTVNGLSLTIATDVTIQGSDGSLVASRIDVTGRGYAASTGPGAGPTAPRPGGGGHGAYGGSGEWNAGGPPYGSVTQPTDFGSGGGSVAPGGTGGGAVRLVVDGTLRVDGSIAANGADGASPPYQWENCAGGGAGGSVYLTVGTLAGGSSGIITANGGNAGGGVAGGGAGGRIAIHGPMGTFSGTLSAVGGANGHQRGGAGTIYRQQTGELIVDNGNASGALTVLDAAVGQLGPVTIRNGAILWAKGPGTIAAGQFEVGTGTTVYFDTAAELAGLHVAPGAMVAPYASQEATLKLTVSGDMTVDAEGGMSVTGRGYAASTGPGAGPTAPRPGGGGHGAYGGSGEWNAGGPPYGSVTQPTDFGSGGGSVAPGGTGGGAVRLVVDGTLRVDGSIAANGADGASPPYQWENCAGGGAGGSVYLTVGTLAGGSSGIITANGGNAGGGVAGGGAGGRIAIHGPMGTFSGTLSAVGGANGHQRGGAGTIYLRQRNTAIAELIVDNGGTSGALTLLHPNTPGLELTDVVGSAGAGILLDGPGELLLHGLVLGADVPAYVNTPTTVTLNLRVGANASIQPQAQNEAVIDLTVRGDAIIEAGGVITVAGRGYSTASTSDPDAGSAPGAGGGHGGYGGGGGAPHGSLTQPTDSGSAGRPGGWSCYAGSGGGAIRMSVIGTLTLDGSIVADGTAGGHCFHPPFDWDSGGSGAGGSIWLDATRFGGGGSISADGASGTGGGGAGGRIAVSSYADAFTGTLSAKGGTGSPGGGAGTIYTKRFSDELGSVRVDNGAVSGANTLLDPGFFDDIEIFNGARLRCISGIWGANRLEVSGVDTMLFIDALDQPVSLGSLHLGSGVLVKPWNASRISLHVAGDATIDTGAVIDVSGLGGEPCSSCDDQGCLTSTCRPPCGWMSAGGGAHGGDGGKGHWGEEGGRRLGNGSGPVGVGCAGGSTRVLSCPGGTGGGAIDMAVGGTLTLDGELHADGADGQFCYASGGDWGLPGGGAGGGILLQAGSVTGTGLISARGGGGEGGGGGGGIVAVYMTACGGVISPGIDVIGGPDPDEDGQGTKGEPGIAVVWTNSIEITSEPAGREFYIGQPVTLQVEATSTTGQLRFQWRKDGHDLAENPPHLVGTQTAVLHVDAATAADAGAYDVVLENDCGTLLTGVVELKVRYLPADFDRDGDVDADDLKVLAGCVSAPSVPYLGDCAKADFDQDGDVDQSDFGIFQRCYSGANKPADSNCGN
ncbi:MAG TPA: hypothetical protein P5159_22995 [Phycisphaerae bacterium]|nr:hypothetical protein [Phycisphaerae bacterium]